MSDLVHGTERMAYGYVDIRAFGRIGEARPHWFSVIWMAVSCCCGLQGEALPVRLPEPSPKVIH